MIVKQVLEKLDIDYLSVELGEVQIAQSLSTLRLLDFGKSLSPYGLELLDDRKSILVERIKKVIVEAVNYED